MDDPLSPREGLSFTSCVISIASLVDRSTVTLSDGAGDDFSGLITMVSPAIVAMLVAAIVAVVMSLLADIKRMSSALDICIISSPDDDDDGDGDDDDDEEEK